MGASTAFVAWATGLGLALLAPLVPVSAQSILGERFAQDQDGQFGACVASIGDVDGDGRPDVLVGVPGSDEVHLLSGSDLSLVRVFSACSGCSFGHSVAGLPDVDGDEIPDLIVGAPNGSPAGTNSGHALLVSGADGRVLRTFDGGAAHDFFGWTVSGAGDVNGDGRPDVMVSAIGSDLGGDGSGSVEVFSTDDGRSLLRASGAAGEQFGHAVAALGRVDADRHADLLVGAPGGNYVQILSGADGGVLLHVDTPPPFLSFGLAVSAVGDLDGDGVPDFIASAPGSFLPGNPGRVQIHSGADGAVLHAFQDIANFGNAVSGVGDANGDGIGDVLVGSRLGSDLGNGQGQAFLFSGTDGGLLWSARGHCSGGLFGQALTGVGDLDGDGAADVVISDPQARHLGTGNGWLRAFSGRSGAWVDLGLGLASFPCPPLLRPRGLMQPGEPVGLDLSYAPPGKPAWIIAGTSPQLTPFQQGVLVPSPDVIIGGLVTGPDGRLSVSGRWPAGMEPGTPFLFQAWLLDFPGTSLGGGQPPAFQASNGIAGFTP